MLVKELSNYMHKINTDTFNFIPYFYTLAKTFECPNILEFGVGPGESTVSFLSAVSENGGKLISIDIRDCENIRTQFKHLPFWKFIKMKSDDFDSNEKYDIILIDTLHTYNQVKKECNLIKKFLKKGTYILFHDIIFKPEINLAIQEFLQEIKYISYIEFKEHHGLGVVII